MITLITYFYLMVYQSEPKNTNDVHTLKAHPGEEGSFIIVLWRGRHLDTSIMSDCPALIFLF